MSAIMPISGFLLVAIFSLKSFALDKIILKFEVSDSNTNYCRIPLTNQYCYQENTHNNKFKLTIHGEGMLEGLDSIEEGTTNDVIGVNCPGYSFLTLDINGPSVAFDSLRQNDQIESKLSYEAKLCFVDAQVDSLDDGSLKIQLTLKDSEYARVAEILKDSIKEALNKVRDTISHKTQVGFSDLEITDFACDKSFALTCTKDHVTHQGPNLSMTGFVVLQ